MQNEPVVYHWDPNLLVFTKLDVDEGTQISVKQNNLNRFTISAA